MMDDIDLSVKDADVFVIIYDVSSEQSFKGSEENEYIQKVISEKKNPKILVLNKIDTISQEQALASVSYTHLRAHETVLDLVCRLLLEKKKQHKSKHH